jgi:monofunctional biosynthetic peptidoglycan transglycosylase
LARAALWGGAALAAALALFAFVGAWEASRIDLGKPASRVPFPTALMRAREREAREHGLPYRIDCRYVGYDRISPLLRRAVLVAEDDAFFHHGGLDWNEIGASARRNLERRRIVRGASTITQQLARNLYLGEERTFARKLKEVALALRLERALSKRRILELYLNLIEWGDGVFGAEAAAARYFGRTAATLDARQALLLAAVIINPHRFSPLAPSPRIERRVRILASRMQRRGQLSDAEYRLAVGEPPEAPGVALSAAESLGAGAPAETPQAPAMADTALAPAGEAPADTAAPQPPR